MEGTGPVRPVAGVSVSPAPRDTQTQTSELPRAKTVAAPERAAETSTNTRRDGDTNPYLPAEAARKKTRERDSNDNVSRQIEIDPETRDVLLKIVDGDTGMVRWQIPAETMMNMRIYAERAAAENDRDKAALAAGQRLPLKTSA